MEKGNLGEMPGKKSGRPGFPAQAWGSRAEELCESEDSV